MRNIMILVFSFGVFAQAQTVTNEVKKVAMECSMSGGPGQNKIEILSQGEYVQHFEKTVGTIYSCGPFVNDGNVIIDSQTQFVEIATDACAIVRELSVSFMIYCRP